MSGTSRLYRKIYGCLVGGAVGDAFGRCTESHDYSEIEKTYGRITAFNPDLKATEGPIPWSMTTTPNGRTHNGEVTDDTRMEHLLIKAILAKGGRVTAEDLASTWREFPLNLSNFWRDFRTSYYGIMQGYPARLTHNINLLCATAATMIAPCGLINACDPYQAYLDGYEVGSILGGYLAASCAGVIAAAIAEAMRPNATLDNVIQVAIKYANEVPIYPERGMGSREKLGEQINRTVNAVKNYADFFEAREALYKTGVTYHFFDPVEVMNLTFGILQVSKGDAWKAIIAGGNFGRDADTICRLAGSISGVLNGVDTIPADQIAAVVKVNIKDKKGYPYLDRPFGEIAIDLEKVIDSRMSGVRSWLAEVEKLKS